MSYSQYDERERERQVEEGEIEKQQSITCLWFSSRRCSSLHGLSMTALNFVVLSLDRIAVCSLLFSYHVQRHLFIVSCNHCEDLSYQNWFFLVLIISVCNVWPSHLTFCSMIMWTSLSMPVDQRHTGRREREREREKTGVSRKRTKSN
jgi:hypothetical protein